MIKKTFKVLLFCAIALLLMIGLESFFRKDFNNSQSMQRLSAFHQQPKDTLDTVLLGPSGLYCGWSSVDAYQNKGFTSWAWSTPSQPLQSTKYIIEDVRQTQNPSLFVIDYGIFLQSKHALIPESRIRSVTDNMSPFTLNRYRAIQDLMPLCKDERIRFSDFIFPFLRFHSEWEQIGSANKDLPEASDTMGTLVEEELTFRVRKVKTDYTNSGSKAVYDPMVMAEIEQLLTWLKEEEIPVLFVLTPKQMPENRIRAANTIEALFDEYGFTHLNLAEKMDEIGIDGKKDFWNGNHVNYWGREKVTAYLADYLSSNYELPDHRNDPSYVAWDTAYTEYLSQIDDLRAKTNAERAKAATEAAAKAEAEAAEAVKAAAEADVDADENNELADE